MNYKPKNRKTDYTKIKRRLYRSISAALIGAVVIVLLFRQLFRGEIGDLIVQIMETQFALDRQDAINFYYYVIRNNLPVILFITILICFFFILRMLLSHFMRYFDEVNTGIDTLMQGEEIPIELSPEMEFMEHKLNTLKQTLEKRGQDARLAEQRKNDLVMYLAHDIKTPLTSVIGYLSLLDEAPDMPVEQKIKYVHITLEKAYRLEQLIDEFFEITRFNLQTITLSRQEIDLTYMLMQMTDEFYPLLSADNKQAVLEAPEDLTVYGDPDKLARVFNNVLKNAIAYSPDHSIIGIKAVADSDDRVSVVFTNDGSIPQDKLDTIFDKFYRLDSARSSDTGGAGLGLAVAREIAAAHGGIIYADSDGQQTFFTVELPVAVR